MLEIKPLHYFVCAYEESSISGAALRCHISQPSISHAIKNLESQLNTSLFTRQKTGLIATREGILLYEKALDLIAQSKNIEQEFKHTDAIDISLYIQDDINALKLVPLIQDLRRLPRLTLKLTTEKKQADFQIIDFERLSQGYEYKKLFNEGFNLILNNEHELSSRKQIKLSDLNGLNLIDRPYCSLRSQFEYLIKQEKLDISTSATANNDLQVLEWVALNFGVALIPEYHQINSHQAINTIKIQHSFHREVIFSYRKNSSKALEVAQMLNWKWIRDKVLSK